MLIYIDPGHGGSDPGAVGGEQTEKALALEISKRVSEVLEANGVKAVLTRSGDSDVTLASRCAAANNAAADGFVSIHLNSNGGTPATGIETLVYSTGTEAYSLAERVQSAVISATGAVDRGVKLRPGLYVLKATRMPAVLVETGFINNDSDRAKLSDPGYQATLATAIARGVCDWAGIAFAPSEEKPLPGDVDGDGAVTVSDVVELRERIVAGEYAPAGDLDGDGKNTASDVIALREKIAKGEAVSTDADSVQAAWKRYILRIQAAVGAEQDGVAGPKTLSLCPVLKTIVAHACVSPVQEYISSLGYDCGAVDGVYGAQTAAAILRFQRDRGLTADGIVGKETWKKLLNL